MNIFKEEIDTGVHFDEITKYGKMFMVADSGKAFLFVFARESRNNKTGEAKPVRLRKFIPKTVWENEANFIELKLRDGSARKHFILPEFMDGKPENVRQMLRETFETK